jgi:glycogen debranching enzyme
MTAALRAAASLILRENDRGAYTVPTKGLYPFQWNWDSCLTALGQRHLDERRAWQEIATLLAHQWPDGMVPHIVFHSQDEGYFPGPEVWRTGRPTPTSGITQPPVMGFVLRRLFEQAADRAFAREQATALLPNVLAWHRWFYACRDPERSGLVAILHPWESGRDNSIDWDAALARVPAEGVEPYTRRDTLYVDPAQRPTRAEYDRYIWLVQEFRALGWDNARLHDASPFKVVDPGFNAILVRADEDAAVLAAALGQDALAAEAAARVAKARVALETLWSEAAGQYLCFDRATGAPVESASVGGLLPLLVALARHPRLAERIRALRERAPHGVPSHDPADPRFDRKRYWRGPSWLIVNYLLVDGLRRSGHDALAGTIIDDSLGLIEASGFAEYYDPLDGAALGGAHFTWTAAMVLELLALRAAEVSA